MSIRTTGTRIVYRNRWMSVREDAIERPSGALGSYGVVDKPDFALIIPFADEGFHLVEQFRYPVGARYWEFPQGSLEDQPRADPLAVARAELEEETGLTASSMRYLGHLFEAYGYCSQGFHVFLATGLAVGTRRLSESEEEQDLRTAWFSLDQFWELVARGEIKDSPTLAAYALFERDRGTPGSQLRGAVGL